MRVQMPNLNGILIDKTREKGKKIFKSFPQMWSFTFGEKRCLKRQMALLEKKILVTRIYRDKPIGQFGGIHQLLSILGSVVLYSAFGCFYQTHKITISSNLLK